MESDANTQAIKDLIVRGELEEAARQLADRYTHKGPTRYQRMALQLQRRLRTLKEDRLRGTISQENADVEQTRIAEGLLYLTDPTSDSQEDLPEALKSRSLPAWQWALIAAGLIGLIVAGNAVFSSFGTSSQTDRGPFDLKIYVYGPGGEADPVREGRVRLLLGNYPVPARDLDSEGRATFDDLPADRLSDTVQLFFDGSRYRTLRQSALTAAAAPEQIIRFYVEPMPDTTLWRGVVFDASRRPLAGVEVNVDDGLARDTTNAQGQFDLAVPKAAGERVNLKVWKDGRLLRDGDQVLSRTEVAQILVKSQ